MIKRVLFLGAAALAMTATSTIAADASRLRFMVPAQASYTGESLGADPATTEALGTNIQYVHSSGFGIGYHNTISFKMTYPDGEYLDFQTASFIDFSYLFGGELTGQIVVGTLIGHGDTESGGLSGETSTSPVEEKSGTAFGLNVGYEYSFPFGKYEALLGYRSESLTLDSTDVSRTLILVGLGKTF
jgi:hypothetical protein